MTQPTLQIGVCDYPEHVPESDWQTHVDMQKALGLSYIRLAEFAWAKIEPARGQFNWAWLDTAIDLIAERGMKVVLGTPTATPPAWLINAHPEILPIDENGQVKNFGSRRHYDFASEVYRQESARITEAMVTRYGEHPAVAGWQTDNELGHEGTGRSYGGASAEAFPGWLKSVYGSLDALNLAWGNEFWSQIYTEWQQIGPPNLTAVRSANPSHVLDYKRFCSSLIESFQHTQIDIIRRLSPGRFITHNFVIFSEESDLYGLSEDLDFVAWDSYPMGMLEFFATWESEETKTRFARTGHPDLISLNHDLYRGLKGGKDFWVMEQQCGHANWAQYNPIPDDGAVALWTAQAWGHGASGIMYFRWRACHMAQEIMHSGLLRHDGSPDRGYQEVASLDLSAFPLKPVQARVALLHDYNSQWIFNQQPHHQTLNYWYQFCLFYRCLRKLGVTVDIIHPRQLGNKDYDVVVAPALTLVNDETAAALASVAASSKLVLGPRTGFRDNYGKVPYQGQFEAIRALTDARMSNMESLRPGLEQKITGNDGKHIANTWVEAYQTQTGTVTHRYSEGPLNDQPCVVESGNVTLVGALSESLITGILKDSVQSRGIETFDLAEGVRITQRGDKTLVCNFTQQSVTHAGETIPPVSFKVM